MLKKEENSCVILLSAAKHVEEQELEQANGRKVHSTIFSNSLFNSIFGSIYKACIQCTEVILYVIHDHSHKQKMETYHSVKKFVFQSSHIQDKLKSVEAFKMVFHKQRPRLCFMCD